MAAIPCFPEFAPAAEEVLEHLERILAAPRFASAPRNGNFLRFVVERTLEGRSSEIKEMVIAMEIYGRPSTYDPKIDSIVRVEATRLRARLQSYYENEGKEESIQIQIPKGTYVPQFERTTVSRVPDPKEADCESKAPLPVRINGPGHTLWPSRTWLGLFLMLGLGCSALLSPGHVISKNPDPEAIAAWKEGNRLLAQDPHTGVSDYGAPLTLQRAIERFEFAVAKDPGVAEAWASLAEAYEYAFPYAGRDREDDLRRAELAARKAVELNKKLPYAHAMLALVLSYLKWDFAGAEAEYQKAISMDPRNPYAVVEYVDLLRQTGRLEEAAREIRKARVLQPALPVLAAKEAEVQLAQKRCDAAIQTATAAIRLNQSYTRAYVVLGAAWEAKGNFERALDEYRKALALDEHDRRALPAYGYLLGVVGRKNEARAVALRLEDMNHRIRNCAFQVAVVYTGLGDHQRALEWLERAYQTRQPAVPLAALEYRLRALHQYPRFQAVLKGLGLRTVA